jgi:uncharacterized protein (DUF488 family)
MLIQKQSSSQPSFSVTSSHPKIYTVGHGTRTVSALLNLLQTAGVTKLVDVRSVPRSFTNPQFNHNVLISSTELREVDVEYVWLGDKLGGFRSARKLNVEQHTAIRVAAFRNYAAYMSTSAFREGLEQLKALVEKHQSSGSGAVAIMCSETLWWRCHRRLIADALVVRGWNVQHLGIRKEGPMEHALWEIARVDDSGNLIYDAKSQR